MGYTNYYTTVKTDTFPKVFVDEVAKLVKNAPMKLVNWNECDIHTTPTVDEHSIVLNGLLNHGHETFVLFPDGEFKFCKTAEKPYDIIVKAILMLGKKYGVVSTWSYDKGENEPHDTLYHQAKQLITDVLENNRAPARLEYYSVVTTEVHKEIRGHHNKSGLTRVWTNPPSLYTSFDVALDDMKNRVELACYLARDPKHKLKVHKISDRCTDVETKERMLHFTISVINMDTSELAE